MCIPSANGTWCDVGWVGKQHNVDCTDSMDVWAEFTSQEVVPVFSCAAPEPRADKQAKTIAGIIVAAGALGKVTHAGDLKICGKSILDETH